jgi:hypothetical protein
MGVEQRPRSVSADPAELAPLHLAMLRIGLFEDAVLHLFLANEVEGTTHLCQGQEAVPVGRARRAGGRAARDDARPTRSFAKTLEDAALPSADAVAAAVTSLPR